MCAHQLLARCANGLQISTVIRGCIAIPSAKSLKRSRPKRKRELPPDMPLIFENVRSPAEIAKAKRRERIPWGVMR